MTPEKKDKLAVLWTIALLPMLFYVYQNQLLSFFDPQEFMTFLNPLKAGTPLSSYLFDGFRWARDGEYIGFFRPVASMTYLVEYQFFHGSPTGYKAVSLVYHLLCCTALAAVLRTLDPGSRTGPLLAAGVFAFHPGAYGAVLWISARPDVLATLFSMLGVVSVLKLSQMKEPSRIRFLPCVFAFLACFSKEVGMANLVTLPVMYFFWDPGAKNPRNTRFLIASLMGVAAVFVTARLLLFHGNMGGYPAYAPISFLYRRIMMLFSQVSGGFFVPWRVLRMIMYSIIPAILIFYGIKHGKTGAGRIAVAIFVTGTYGFQSLLGNPELHYSYIASCFTVVFAAYFMSRLVLPTVVNAGVTVFLIVIMVFGSRHLSFSLVRLDQALETVYLGLEEVAPELEPHEGETIGVYISGDSYQAEQSRHIPLLMEFIAPGRYTFEYVPERDFAGPLLYWEGDSPVLER